VDAPQEQVIRVDSNDVEVGIAGKLDVHIEGLLHRAVSVLVADRSGALLLQRRANGKYHSAGLWTNSCCGHPRPGEDSRVAASRRLHEEMGVACELQSAGHFQYRARLANGLVEHELDHVFVGALDGEPSPDPAEVQAWRLVPLDELRRELRETPDRFTAWLPQVLAQAVTHPLLAAMTRRRGAATQ
jgi:isopentenyl-diphosphate Delta-isomerase